MPPKMPPETQGQERFLFELSRTIPEVRWVTQVSEQLKVGDLARVAGKRGIIRLLFFEPKPGHFGDVGAVIAWEDGSVTVPRAVLDYLAKEK